MRTAFRWVLAFGVLASVSPAQAGARPYEVLVVQMGAKDEEPERKLLSLFERDIVRVFEKGNLDGVNVHHTTEAKLAGIVTDDCMAKLSGDAFLFAVMKASKSEFDGLICQRYDRAEGTITFVTVDQSGREQFRVKTVLVSQGSMKDLVFKGVREKLVELLHATFPFNV